MAIRKIIRIDEEKCDGCGECVTACAEGAIALIDGKAKLVSETYCDGLGACLGDCPQGAISIEEREAAEFDETAVAEHLTGMKTEPASPLPSAHGSRHAHGGCPGAALQTLQRRPAQNSSMAWNTGTSAQSQLGQWPVQLMLVPPHVPFLKGADILICADCVPFAVPDFHQRYLAGRAVLVGCPKLDDLQHYYEKLQEIFATAKPRRITVLRMEVPCCGGIGQAAVQARNLTMRNIPLEIHTIGIRGEVQIETVEAEHAA